MTDLVFIVAIICFTVYKITALGKNPKRYEELNALHELREKGVITQTEFEKKKAELLE